jgi:hypothetical protein
MQRGGELLNAGPNVEYFLYSVSSLRITLSFLHLLVLRADLHFKYFTRKNRRTKELQYTTHLTSALKEHMRIQWYDSQHFTQ